VATSPATPRMTSVRPLSLDRRLADRTRVLTAPVPVIVGGCGCGRTERLRRLHRELGTRTSQYIDFERVATTPERCLKAIVDASPFRQAVDATPAAETTTARGAYDAMLAFFMNAASADGAPATFLLDEVLELRTFESFPGLRAALPELARALAYTRNRFIVCSRFSTRAARWSETVPERYELLPLAPLSQEDVREAMVADLGAHEAEDLAGLVHALTAGRPSYVRLLIEAMMSMTRGGTADPISALAASLSRGGGLDQRCRFSYELRLHRARGYGALKAILDLLAEDEPLTLTQISQRLGRTPGSTKDYLSWLQDVDMLASHRKRYTYSDPLLRLWVRLHSHPTPPGEERTAAEVQTYTLQRLELADAERAKAGAALVDEPAAVGARGGARSGIIEID